MINGGYGRKMVVKELFGKQKLERVVWFLMESVRCFQQKTIGNMKQSEFEGVSLCGFY